MTVGSSHEWDECPGKRDSGELSGPSCYGRHGKKTVISDSALGSHQTLHELTSLQNCEREVSVIHKPPIYILLQQLQLTNTAGDSAKANFTLDRRKMGGGLCPHYLEANHPGRVRLPFSFCRG